MSFDKKINQIFSQSYPKIFGFIDEMKDDDCVEINQWLIRNLNSGFASLNISQDSIGMITRTLSINRYGSIISKKEIKECIGRNIRDLLFDYFSPIPGTSTSSIIVVNGKRKSGKTRSIIKTIWCSRIIGKKICSLMPENHEGSPSITKNASEVSLLNSIYFYNKSNLNQLILEMKNRKYDYTIVELCDFEDDLEFYNLCFNAILSSSDGNPISVLNVDSYCNAFDIKNRISKISLHLPVEYFVFTKLDLNNTSTLMLADIAIQNKIKLAGVSVGEGLEDLQDINPDEYSKLICMLNK